MPNASDTMYIGQYFFVELKDVWVKHSSRPCLLFTADEDGRLKPALNQDNEQEVVNVRNVIGTFAPKSIRFPEPRYCTIDIIDETYWLVSAEC